MRIKKNLGQNFLVDTNIISKIVRSINPQYNQHILEIGPGKGALTKEVIEKVEYLDVVEVDKDLIPFISNLAEKEKNFTIYNENILKFDLKRIKQKKNKKIRLIGNLPYNISSPILLWSLRNLELIQDQHFMFQKEFAERIVATPGNKAYGRLSIISQYLSNVEILFSIPAGCFRPIPEVDSSFIRIIPKENMQYDSKTSQTLQTLTHNLFSKRRKMIGKTLKNIISPEDLRFLGINQTQRPEELSVENFVKLAETINAN
mgnify:CR=1 FL=1